MDDPLGVSSGPQRAICPASLWQKAGVPTAGPGATLSLPTLLCAPLEAFLSSWSSSGPAGLICLLC